MPQKKPALWNMRSIIRKTAAWTSASFSPKSRNSAVQKAGGVCFRCRADGKIGYASTELMDEEELRALPSRAVENAALIENTDSDDFYGTGDNYRQTETEIAPLAATGDYIDKALACQKACYDADSRVSEGTETSAGGYRTVIRLFNSNGWISLRHTAMTLLSLCRLYRTATM